MGTLMPEPVSDRARRTVIQLLKKHDSDITKTYESFIENSSKKMSKGSAPNSIYGEVVDLFSRLMPIEEVLIKLKDVQSIAKSDAIDNIIFDNIVQVNQLLGDNVMETPDVKGMGPNEELMEYEQAIIRIANEIPNVRDNSKRENLMWVIGLLSQTVNDMKSGSTGVMI